MNTTASLMGIGFAVIAFLVLIHAMELMDIVMLVKRGLLAIFAFVVLGMVAQMILPGFITVGFMTCTRSSLFLGVAIIVVGLAIALLAKRRGSKSIQGKH